MAQYIMESVDKFKKKKRRHARAILQITSVLLSYIAIINAKMLR